MLKSEENSLESLTSTLFKTGSLGYFLLKAGWAKSPQGYPFLDAPIIALGLQILVTCLPFSWILGIQSRVFNYMANTFTYLDTP